MNVTDYGLAPYDYDWGVRWRIDGSEDWLDSEALARGIACIHPDKAELIRRPLLRGPVEVIDVGPI